MLHLLHRDLPDAASTKKHDRIHDGDEADEEDAVLSGTTRSRSTRSIASSYVRAMHTAIIVLGREAHPRSILCPLTSAEWRVLVSTYGVPESMLQGHKVTPKFNYSTCGGVESQVNSEWEFLKYRSAGPFYRDQYIGHVYFAVRAMALARQNKPGGSLATVHRECRRVALATTHAAKASFDHGLTVVNSMLQNTKDLFEPDAAAMLAIKAFRPGADISSAADKGRLLQAEVRRQLALYHKELLAVSRRRISTIAVNANLDAGGLDRKVAGGRLPEDLSLITEMLAQLWLQAFQPVWSKVIDPWLQLQKTESTLQAYLATESADSFAEFADKQGLTQQDICHLRVLLQLELSFLRSQVWLGCTVSEFKLIEHDSRKLYEFRTSRSFKTCGKAGAGSLPAATRWPLSEKQSAVVHTLLHGARGGERLFPKLTQQAVFKTFSRLGWNWCGVPKLGPHAMRTYHCSKAVNNGNTTAQDYPALASRMQVSVDTMKAVYVAPSLRAPAAQLAFKLHANNDKEQRTRLEESVMASISLKEQPQQKKGMQADQKQQQEEQKQLQQQQQLYNMRQQIAVQQYMQQQYLSASAGMSWLPPTTQATPVAVCAATSEPVLYGKALSSLRHKYDAAIMSYLRSDGLNVHDNAPAAAYVAAVFKDLCSMRASHSLPPDAAWFRQHITHFADDHETPFKNYIRKLFATSST
jgi:hypothetical protein